MSENDSTQDNLTFDDEISSEITNDLNTNILKNNLNSVEENYNNYYKNLKFSHCNITKFEKAKIIGIRAQMLAKGSNSTIDIPDDITDTITIATLEFEQKKIPLIIKRTLPNNITELWRIEDFN